LTLGFSRPSLDDARREIQRCIGEIRSPYNDGFTSSACKHDLYLLKSWLDDQYQRLPRFTGEEKWEQERLIQVLKQSES
jgi:hypothetical protein